MLVRFGVMSAIELCITHRKKWKEETSEDICTSGCEKCSCNSRIGIAERYIVIRVGVSSKITM